MTRHPGQPPNPSQSTPSQADQKLRKIRHDMLNTIGVIKLELHAARRHADQHGAQAIDSVQEEVRVLQRQLDQLCEEAREISRIGSPPPNSSG